MSAAPEAQLGRGRTARGRGADSGDFGIDAARSWLVGDHTRDIETARRAGLGSILVRTGHAGRDGGFDVRADHIVDDLLAVARLIAETATVVPA